jgi:hypothetical protein
MDAKPILIHSDKMVIPRENMLFCLCRVCANELNWRHRDASFLVWATCCCHQYIGQPAGRGLKAYLVETRPADMTRVYWLERKPQVELGPPPKYA